MVRWGIAGLGRMAEKMAAEFALTSNATLVAVASRSQSRADEFAAEVGADRAYGSYQALIDDADVDAIYVANPHPQHRAIAVPALRAGKACLIEKSFASTMDGVRDIVDAARASGSYCAEALWSRFVPAIVALRHELADGVIGEPRGVQGDLQAFRAYDPSDRLFARELGGGALLDLGVYTMSAIHDVLGAPASTHAVGSLLPNGVDGSVVVSLDYGDGRLASFSCGFTTYGPARMSIFGTQGYAEINPRMHHAESYTIVRPGEEPRTETFPLTGSGHWHMLQAVSDDIAAGRTESAIMPLQATVDIAESLQAALAQLGVEYADDQPLD